MRSSPDDGRGKSELLQTLIASLAAAYPPTRLTFLLVDYKGGAAFKDCVRLPHTVGFVTDLDGHLAHRALVSLNAELRRRERILREVGARDLVELEARDPERAPPSLVIVIDEFATLARRFRSSSTVSSTSRSADAAWACTLCSRRSGPPER